MATRHIKKIAVIGAGQMGGGIAQIAAAIAKLPVVLFDKSNEQLAKQKDFIRIWNFVYPTYFNHP